jgi:hypothetical protein
MDAKAKSKSFPRMTAILAALEPSLLPPLIALICEYSPLGPCLELCTAHSLLHPSTTQHAIIPDDSGLVMCSWVVAGGSGDLH